MQSMTLRLERERQYRMLLARTSALDGENLAKAIPQELFTPRAWRGLVGLAVSYALYVGSIVAVGATHWSLWLPLWVLSGLGGWGMFCIAHDCGHGSLSRSGRLNTFIGHLAVLPLLYPFHAWRHAHNLHHMSTNSLELDKDWRPVSYAVYSGLPLRNRLVYRGIRSIFFWLGSAHLWWESVFRRDFFLKRSMRSDAARSAAIMALAIAAYFPALIYFTGWVGLLKFFVAPWLAIHAWFSMTTLMHHTAEDVPFLARKHWRLNGSRLLLTTDYRYPKWLHFLTHNISLHTAHHVAPVVPYYNLPGAREAIRTAYPGLLREKEFSFRALFRIVTHCHLFDAERGCYESFGEAQANLRLAGPART